MVEKEFRVSNIKGMWEVFEKVGEDAQGAIFRRIDAPVSLIYSIIIKVPAIGHGVPQVSFIMSDCFPVDGYRPSGPAVWIEEWHENEIDCKDGEAGDD